MLLFVANEYEIGITVRHLGVSGVTRNYRYFFYMATPTENVTVQSNTAVPMASTPVYNLLKTVRKKIQFGEIEELFTTSTSSRCSE